MKTRWFGLAALCFWVSSGLAADCDWDQSVSETQTLDSVALNALRLGDAVPGSPESCRSACCNSSDCDLVLVTAQSECVLVRCWRQGRDQCVLRVRQTNDFQTTVYRKKVTPQPRSAPNGTGTGAGAAPRVVPMVLGRNVAPMVPEPTETNQTGDSVCRQPVKVGSCRAAFRRFFYNATEQRCVGFVYGGCKGNGNNFLSQEMCEETCSGVAGPVLEEPTPTDPPVKAFRMAPENPDQDHTELCLVEPSTGPCRAAFPRWFYDSRTGSCEKFTYGGCGGNRNNYKSKESCVAACTVSVLPSAKEPSPGHERCRADADAGHCRAAFPRWFYNHKTGSCETFVYGGCGGNDNNFDSRESCVAACTGSFDSLGESRHERRAAFFLFVALAVMAALLLLTLVLVSLRRRRLSRRSSIVSDKQELLPDDKHSSLESLSVPDSPRPGLA